MRRAVFICGAVDVREAKKRNIVRKMLVGGPFHIFLSLSCFFLFLLQRTYLVSE